jgi:hypothetical protein
MAVSLQRGTNGYPAAINDIDSWALTQGGNEVQMYPGSYAAPTDVVASDFAYVGMGDEVIIDGAMTIAAGSTGPITFKNIHFRGADAGAAAGSVCVTKLGNAACELHFVNCKFSNAEHAVNQQANLASTADGLGIRMEYCDASGVDQAIVSNCNAEISFSQLNISANAYYTVGGGEAASPTHTVTVRASSSGGANSGNMTETVLALIS